MTEHDKRALSFGGVADAYDRGRPSYPAEAIAWLVAGAADVQAGEVTVLEVGAGTGKLTEGLVAAGHEVHATDPDAAMLAVLADHLPGVRTSTATAEQLPVPDRSVDVVVGAQCYHWFRPDVALPEIARVLNPGGHIALVWNERNEKIPWVRKLGRIIGSPSQLRDPSDDLVASGLFEDVELETFTHWQHVDRRSIQDLARSRSEVALMGEESRARLITDLLALYDDYGRGMDGMQLPYLTRCFRARVVERAALPEPEPTAEPDDEGDGAWEPDSPLESTMPIALGRPSSSDDEPSRSARMTDSASTLPRVAHEVVDDDAIMLIDFR